MDKAQCTKETVATVERRPNYVRLNVGGTIRYVERALVGIAPLGSRAHAYLTAAPDATDLHFVDERPQHFARLLDCLRHGDTALAFMRPYDAAIVRRLLTPIEPKGVDDHGATHKGEDSAMSLAQEPTTTDRPLGTAPVGHDGGAEQPCAIDPVIRLLVDGDVPMDVAQSTLTSPPDSLLARMARGDVGWSPAADGDRLCIDQNHRHFGLLLDCLRHGAQVLQFVDDLYDLWGVRALGTYYAIDIARDAAQLAIGWRGYLEADKNDRCTTYIVEPGTPASISGLYSGSPLAHFMHSSHVSLTEFVALAAAAVGAPSDAVVVYASPYGDKWYPVAGDDDDTDYWDYTRCHHASGRISVAMVEARPLVALDDDAATTPPSTPYL
ncbi:BTB/POZ domain motif-containing protein [Pandoravirus inopinatum]|uniref:BTB/POZ domain motif-containing protein n=1 Tax=Pandoravirus inopinatum TaxID=1605721 RepID=A0A0B5J157_9VIRU|nr:BTB/POZ domain motif-containing protein [Pandoravirus inopinatum]AJF97179.1 BTB/POZ domain motif-containing protein [Pandoravirus inopinatum]